ncbi:hypothetical protein ACFXEL_06085 [Streptomyces sp. NPDC059382]|uniref:hypothetical protein n=1 Tax=Streptomyces sp. NPDC059382 TaxID=3346816 RepID=UPI0036D04334
MYNLSGVTLVLVRMLRFPSDLKPQAGQLAPQPLLLGWSQSEAPDAVTEVLLGDHTSHRNLAKFAVQLAERVPESGCRISLASSLFTHGHPPLPYPFKK